MGTMGKYNMNANVVCAIEHLYDKSMRAVQMNGSTGAWFRKNIWSYKPGYLLSPTLFKIFLGGIMSDDLEQHD